MRELFKSFFWNIARNSIANNLFYVVFRVVTIVISILLFSHLEYLDHLNNTVLFQVSGFIFIHLSLHSFCILFIFTLRKENVGKP